MAELNHDLEERAGTSARSASLPFLGVEGTRAVSEKRGSLILWSV